MRAGSPVERYERAFAGRIGPDARASSFWKGRVALSAILEAMGIGPGDDVLLPGYTCVVVPNAVAFRGARPIYADVREGTFDLDPASVRARLTGRTRAIVVQHTYGIPGDASETILLARERGIAVIEDSAHALGLRPDGTPFGALGDAAFFSSQWSKPYSTGLGGMAVTRDAALAARIAEVQSRCRRPSARDVALLRAQMLAYRRLLTPGLYWRAMRTLRALSARGLLVGSSDPDELRNMKPKGYDKRMSAAQARWGLRALERSDADAAHRRAIAQRYAHGLAVEGFDVGKPDPAWTLVRFPLAVHDKRGVLARAEEERVELGDWFDHPLHPLAASREGLGYVEGSCPVAERLSASIVNLPTHTRIDAREADRVVAFLARERKAGRA